MSIACLETFSSVGLHHTGGSLKNLIVCQVPILNRKWHYYFVVSKNTLHSRHHWQRIYNVYQ